jgi:hypothetical protein
LNEAYSAVKYQQSQGEKIDMKQLIMRSPLGTTLLRFKSIADNVSKFKSQNQEAAVRASLSLSLPWPSLPVPFLRPAPDRRATAAPAALRCAAQHGTALRASGGETNQRRLGALTGGGAGRGRARSMSRRTAPLRLTHFARPKG